MINGSVGTLLQDLLFLFIVVVAPIWDLYATPKLKRDPSSERKIGYYRTICVGLWIATALAIAAVGPRPLFTIVASAADIPWLLAHPWVRYLAAALIAVFVVLSAVLPAAIVIWKKLTNRPRKYASAALASLNYFLPATWVERRWWVFLSITAGVCEETLFRGFMLQYLHVFPWALNLTVALLFSSLVFGLNHLYQGAAGVLGTAIGGFLFGLLFLLTGNLLLPIIIHAAIDLRALLVVRPPAESPSS